MENNVVEPKPSISFFFKNLIKLIKLRMSNPEKVEKFLASNKRLNEAIIPDFEGYSGPMEEGMIYLMFNSDGQTKSPMDINSVMRLFWVTAPDLNFHQIDSYIISNEHSNQWDFASKDRIFMGQKKNSFKQIVNLDHIELTIEGNWNKGYHYIFDDKKNNISGNLKLTPLNNNAVLTYYNSRWGVNPSAYQKFYDMFGLKAEGSVKLGDRELQLDNARAIIEHSIGIFSTYNIKEWYWLNLQLTNGAVHLFLHPLKIDDQIIPAAEGAAVIDGDWYHFLRDEIVIDNKEMTYDDIRNEEIPVSWKVSVMYKGNEFMNLNLNTINRLSWLTILSETDKHYVTNYVLNVKGKIDNKDVNGRGTMEYLIHRTE